METLRPKLLQAHFKLRNTRRSVIIIVAGVEGAGKGDLVWKLNEWLDPRGTSTHVFRPLDRPERGRPSFWLLAQVLPARGRVSILLGSWYTTPTVQRVQREISSKEFKRELARIQEWEQMLVKDGAVLLKLWLHVSRRDLRRRLGSLVDHPELHARLLPPGLDLVKLYPRFLKISTQALNATHAAGASWHRIDASDPRARDLQVARLLNQTLKTAAKPASAPPAISARTPVSAPPASTSRLRQVDLSASLTQEEYTALRDKYRRRLLKQAWRLLRRRRSCLIVFEGWDAAGKGGAIRRLTQALDPRLYQVYGFSAPTAEELAHHYLWRFWKVLPGHGTLTIFDRSHYGRVLVERVEGFAQPEEWRRAYAEINAFEAQLDREGVIIVKFWLQISPEEQLRRFRERERVAWKNYKITADDWRNRKKRAPYEAAVEEMLERTDTSWAPWTVVPANDKHYARVEILRTIARRLRSALD